jgi:hypothetical protein
LGDEVVEKNLDREDRFLLKEYDAASQLTYHIDELRNKLTGLFLIFVGLAVGGLTLLIKGEAKDLFEPVRLIALLFVVISLLGFLVVGILARLRKVQLEHFRIINNIRKHFLGSNATLWKVVELSEITLPLPQHLSGSANRSSGSYLWVLIIVFINSLVVATSSYLIIVKIYALVGATCGRLMALLGLLILILIQDQAYFSLAAPPEPRLFRQ